MRKKYAAPSEYKFRTQVRVRTYEIDMQGIVHNSYYLRYFEVARMDYARAIGQPIESNLLNNEHKVVIVHQEIDYITPGFLEEVLDVYTRPAWIGETSFAFEGVIYRGTELLCAGTTVLVWLDPLTNTPTLVPQEYVEVLEKYEGRSLRGKTE